MRGTNPRKTRVLVIASAEYIVGYAYVIDLARIILFCPFIRRSSAQTDFYPHPLGYTLLEGAAFPGSIRPLIPPLSRFLAELLLWHLNQSLKVAFQWPATDHQRVVYSPEASLFSPCPRFQGLFANPPTLQQPQRPGTQLPFTQASSPHVLISSLTLQPCKFSRRESCREACGLSLAMAMPFLLGEQAAQPGHQGLRCSRDRERWAFGNCPAKPHVRCNLT